MNRKTKHGAPRRRRAGARATRRRRIASRPEQKRARSARVRSGWHNRPPAIQNRTYARKLDRHAVTMARQKDPAYAA